MSMIATPKHDKAGNVVGVILDIDFATKAKPSGSGKTLIDFSTRGNKALDLEGLKGKPVKEVICGINMYHYP